jgi:hypothetical protein
MEHMGYGFLLSNFWIIVIGGYSFLGSLKTELKHPFFRFFDICPGFYHQDVPPHKPSLSDSPCDSEIETSLLNSSPLYSNNVR